MALHDGFRLYTGLWMLVQGILLVFYIRGALRYRHGTFLILIIASCLGVISIIAMTAGYFVTLSQPAATELYQWGLILGFPSLLIGLWGMLSLLMAYDRYARPVESSANNKGEIVMIKAALAKIAHGLLVGIGFAVALGVLMYVYSTWQMRQFEEKSDDIFGFKQYGADAGLVIKEHRPQRAENNTAFLGVMGNNGEDTWERVEVLVELFAQDGAFVDKCSSYMDGLIVPGQERNFKVSCSGCRDPAQPVAYDRYTIEIVDAGYVSQKGE
jgi:hypothetical protein